MRYEGLDILISTLMYNLGITPNILGHNYIKDSLEMVLGDEGYLRYITKALYPDIASKRGTTASRVERAIRHSISKSFDSRRTPFSEKIYSNIFAGRKPTNSEFIGVLSDMIRMSYSNEVKIEDVVREVIPGEGSKNILKLVDLKA